MKANKEIKREARQLLRLCLVDGLLDEARIRKTVQTVLDARRRETFPLLSHFLRLVKLERTQHTAHVESATLLPAAFETSILSNLERMYGPGISTSFALNPSLIGGMRIQVGSDVYDGSVRAGLASLQRSF